LWPAIADGISILQPALCFFENVEGHISLGLSTVVSDLEGLGYKVAFGLFSASEVGAPHQRKRIFVLAHRIGERGLVPNQWCVSGQQMPVRDGQTRGTFLADSIKSGSQGCAAEQINAGGLQRTIGRGCNNLWPSRPGQPQHRWEPPRVVGQAQLGNSNELGSLDDEQSKKRRSPATVAKPSSDVGDADVADSYGGQSRQERGDDGQVCSISETQCQSEHSSRLLGGKGVDGTESVGNTKELRRAGLRESGSGIISEQINELTDTSIRQTEPALGGDADGFAGGMDYAELCVSSDNRTDELRLLGNGVVPATAERAFTTLMQELFP
jgi:site-specific DNA-cytosine methylase